MEKMSARDLANIASQAKAGGNEKKFEEAMQALADKPGDLNFDDHTGVDS